jgi:hypothetical protein
MFTEILKCVNDDDLSESGGGHGQKGVDFQRYWAIKRIIDLEDAGVKDFLILIEAIQDVAELDSTTSPTSICMYQVKKKDRNEWSWNKLTNLGIPKSKSKSTKGSFKDSSLGKLYASVIAFDKLNASGRFISNSGCNIPLASGGNAATSLLSCLNHLSDDYKQLIREKMVELSSEAKADSTLPRIYLEKVALPPDDPKTHLIGHAYQFLEKRSPKHSGQARSFVDALMAIISPLGSKTDTCSTFDELCDLHGFTRKQFVNALSDLEVVPDLLAYLETWLNQLTNEGLGFLDITAIRASTAAIYRNQLLGNTDISQEDEALINDCNIFLEKNDIPAKLLPFFESAYDHLVKCHSTFTRPQILSQFALRAISKCVDQI